MTKTEKLRLSAVCTALTDTISANKDWREAVRSGMIPGMTDTIDNLNKTLINILKVVTDVIDGGTK